MSDTSSQNSNKLDYTLKNPLRFFAPILPGIFLMGYNIGTGSLTAMSKAGANFGTDLLWTVLLSCLITWYLINFFSRFTMVTGMTAMEAYKESIHPIYAWTLWALLSVIVISALMAMLGLLADVVLVASREFWSVDLNRMTVGVVITTFVYGLVLWGNIKRFEAMLSVMVALMALAFIGAAIWFFPGFKAVMSGFIPSVPANATGSDNSSLIILSSMVGTTVSVFAFLIRSGQVKSHGWSLSDWKAQKRDAFISAILMFTISAAVLITASATLHVEGLKMNHIKEMVPMLSPLFGPFALFIFVIGILAAGISSHLPNMMVIPWLADDLAGRSRVTRTRGKRLAIACLAAISALGAFVDRPLFLMLLSQAGISVVMPMALIGLIYLSTRSELLGNQRPKTIEWALLAAITCFSLFMSWQALKGLLADLLP